ncbi:MAG: PAS domain S-box protein [Halomonadaceae bacterium]|nr:MAG: PAS domain S-box protein [Halomonadaceae bacterium]
MAVNDARSQEQERLNALASYHILDTPEEKHFDELTQLAADICDAPVALITLIDRHRQWFKSRVGMDATETPLDNSFCAQAVASHTLLTVVEDATEHPVFKSYEAVTEGDVRFYAGALLLSPQGMALGTLCVVGHEPRTLDPWQGHALQVLARQVVHQLELRRANRLLARETDQLQNLVDNVPVMLAQLDEQGRYLFANHLYRRWGGLEGQDLRGCLPQEVLPAALLKKRQSRINRCLKGQRIQVEEVQQDQRIQDMVYMPLATVSGQQGVLIVGRDITESKRAEAVKNEFVSTVSHELRTPLTSIIGALGLATGGALGELPEQAKTMLDLAHGNSQRLKHLINDLLDMDKLVAGQMHFDMTVEPLAPLLERAVQDMQIFSQEYAVAVECQAPDPALAVEVDEYRFLQIMTNLLSNAIKFSPGDTTVAVSVTEQEGQVLISVVDQGPGIALEAQGKLFQRFYQVDGSSTRQKGGTGLGLAISRELAERMKGQLTLSSAPGEGSCFTLTLPLRTHPGSRDESVVLSLLDQQRKGNRLLALHVEDDEDLQRVLSMVGTELAVFDGVTTLNAARQALRNNRYDLVLLDLELPDGCGWSLLAEIQSLHPAPAVVVLTGMDTQVPDNYSVDVVLIKSRVTDDEFRQTLAGFLAKN